MEWWRGAILPVTEDGGEMGRVLVAHASKRGGTTGIAEMIADRLEERGLESAVTTAGKARRFEGFDAVVIGSALYGGRWLGAGVRALRRVARMADPPAVWVFHSGPLGDEAADDPQKPPRKVEALAERLGADVVTFGGRLLPDTSGFIAKAMVRNGLGGDWRDRDQIRGYADAIAEQVIGSEAA
jgi:menaquinone-dependent protoporphyrinogen oxidase